MIRKVKARTIFDMRAHPTLEVDLFTEFGMFRSSVPNDLHENPHGLKQLRNEAVNIVNNIIGPELVNAKLSVDSQAKVDEFLIRLDGTEDKSKLGSVAMFGVSSAVCKAGASKKKLPFAKYIAQIAENKKLSIPIPAFSVITGGIEANNDLLFTDFMIVPLEANNFEEAYEMGNHIYRKLETKIAEMDDEKLPLTTSVTGAFVPKTIEDDNAVIDIISGAINEMGYGDKVKIQVNVDASNFFETETGMYNLNYKSSPNSEYSNDAEEVKEFYENLLKSSNVISIIDPFGMDDLESWSSIVNQTKKIVCNELGVMRPNRIQDAIDQQAANCLLVEPWRAGTITESLLIARVTKINDWDLNVSAGYSQTEDHFMSHYATGISATIFQAGAPTKTTNYNQILRIEKEFDAKYGSLAPTF